MSTTREILLIVIVDALGWDIVNACSFLGDICAHRAKVRTVFGFSSAALPTIYTGKYPDEHGRWSMWYYSPADSMFRTIKLPGMLPEIKFGRKNISRYLAQWIYRRSPNLTEYFSLYDIPLRYLHLFDLASKKDIYSSGAFNTPSIFDLMESCGRKYYAANWKNSEEQAFGGAMAAVEQGCKICFIYTPVVDAVMHTTGPDLFSPVLKETLNRQEQAITKLYRKAAQHSDKVTLIVASDHGMTEVDRQIDVFAVLERLPFQNYRDYVVFLDSTMARFTFINPKAKKEIDKVLAELAGLSPVCDEILQTERVLFSDRRYGESIFVCDPGTVINPSMMGSIAPKGMHGYMPGHSSTAAAFLCSEPVGRSVMHIREYYDVLAPLIVG